LPTLDWFPATAGVCALAGAPDIAPFLFELATLLLPVAAFVADVPVIAGVPTITGWCCRLSTTTLLATLPLHACAVASVPTSSGVPAAASAGVSCWFPCPAFTVVYAVSCCLQLFLLFAAVAAICGVTGIFDAASVDGYLAIANVIAVVGGPI
jgi:hypothetical protein